MNQSLLMEQQEPVKQESEDFIKFLDTLPSPEEKLKASIAYMKEALAQEGTPNFKGFWEIRRVCLPQFKENLRETCRTELWNDYIELTREGRRLKGLLDEETAFAVEQIDLAIGALEEEVKGYHTHHEEILEKTLDIEFPEKSATIEGSYNFYQQLQKQLNLLNLYASKINTLRKELIRTEMRIRQKNKFFQRLSLLGDQVFPPRKEMIQTLSVAFHEDVNAFVNQYFSEQNFDEERMRRAVFFLRGEIKSLQSLAKILTLNTHVFSSTRELLSQCWDKLKGMEKELKKDYAEQKQKSNENAQKVQEKIDLFLKEHQESALSYEEGMQRLEDISRFMRSVELNRYDVRGLKEQLLTAKTPFETKHEEELKALKQKEAEFEKARHEKAEAFKLHVAELQRKMSVSETAILSADLEEARKTLQTLSISKVEKQQIERNLKALRDQLAEKESRALISLSDADRAALEDLEELASRLSERRKEIKAQLEEYRKIMGGSGLDFEKAMRYHELVETEKESLSKIDESLDEIQKKMRLVKKAK